MRRSVIRPRANAAASTVCRPGATRTAWPVTWTDAPGFKRSGVRASDTCAPSRRNSTPSGTFSGVARLPTFATVAENKTVPSGFSDQANRRRTKSGPSNATTSSGSRAVNSLPALLPTLMRPTSSARKSSVYLPAFASQVPFPAPPPPFEVSVTDSPGASVCLYWSS